jgi:hypothetical protein
MSRPSFPLAVAMSRRALCSAGSLRLGSPASSLHRRAPTPRRPSHRASLPSLGGTAAIQQPETLPWPGGVVPAGSRNQVSAHVGSTWLPPGRGFAWRTIARAMGVVEEAPRAHGKSADRPLRADPRSCSQAGLPTRIGRSSRVTTTSSRPPKRTGSARAIIGSNAGSNASWTGSPLAWMKFILWANTPVRLKLCPAPRAP